MSGGLRFILCADDFAMSRGISDGILALAEAGRLSATSAMVNQPRWAEDAPRAVALRDRFALGLHLNLTFGAPLGAMHRDFQAAGLTYKEVVEEVRRELAVSYVRQRHLPFSEIATTEGVVLYPPLLARTTGVPPSTMATQEFVVPRSMPMTFDILDLPFGCGRPCRPFH